LIPSRNETTATEMAPAAPKMAIRGTNGTTVKVNISARATNINSARSKRLATHARRQTPAKSPVVEELLGHYMDYSKTYRQNHIDPTIDLLIHFISGNDHASVLPRHLTPAAFYKQAINGRRGRELRKLRDWNLRFLTSLFDVWLAAEGNELRVVSHMIWAFEERFERVGGPSTSTYQDLKMAAGKVREEAVSGRAGR
jgi:hypothetical protein